MCSTALKEKTQGIFVILGSSAKIKIYIIHTEIEKLII